MDILITNDDGFRARGIEVLASMMARFGDVRVVAPKTHQSGMSMAVSLGFRKITAKDIPEKGPGRWTWLNATPASCVKFALNYDYPDRKPDVVLCGINHGSNAASASCYSGTLGAAAEGALNGVPSIGISISDYRPDADFTAIEKYFPLIFTSLMETWPRDNYGLFYNINFPGIPVDEIKGIRVCRQGRGHWEKEYRDWDIKKITYVGVDPEVIAEADRAPVGEGEKTYMMVGDFVDDEVDENLGDHRLLNKGWITIVPDQIDMTDYDELTRLLEKGFNRDFR